VFTSQPLDSIPIWAIYLLTVLLMFAVMEGGYRLGKTRLQHSIAKPKSGVGVIVAGTLGLLAFLLAFVVGFAGKIFNERRELVIAEANAIGSAYLWASYLDEPYQIESRELLHEYVDMRLAARDPETREMALARSEQIHAELWSIAEIVGKDNPNDTIIVYIESINEIINLHTQRVNLGVGIRVPQPSRWVCI
jgi:hypothetical protein